MQPAEAAEIVELLAIAMACAHANGVIHRDLKPANVLLTKDGLPKITDFGLAKRLESDSGATRSGALMGTPSYMAPEQAMGDTHHIGPPADIYALGVILYELLTGRTPFVGSSIMDTLEQVRKAEPVPPRRLVPKIPKDVETICLKCLQKEQYKRYSSADDLAADLRRFRDGKPISARPVGTVERAWRWCRRNPRIAALSSLVGLLVVAVAITWIVMAGNAARERKAIEETRQFAEQRLQKAGDAVHDSDLGDVRGRLTELRDQLAIYIEFKTALDNARYHGLFGSKATLKKAQGYCTWVLQIIGQIEQLQSNGRRGLPPLTDEQLELYREDVFESYLVAAQVEMSLASGAKSADQKASAARALEWLNRAERALPGMRVLHVRRGDILRTLGEVEAARKDSTTANGIVPRSAVDLFWHGIEEHERGDTARPASLPQAQRHYRNAMEDYAKLVRIRPDHFWAYFDWAECQYELNDSYDAIVGFTTCIHVRRDVAWPYYNRGNIYLNLKQFDLAIQDYDDAIKKHPEYTTAYYNRGIAHWETKRSDLAIADLDQAIALDPEYSRPYLKKAQIYRSLKEYDKAEREYEKAIAAEPAYAEAFTDRATMYFQRGDLAKAREDFSRVIAIQPSDPTGYANRGTINLLAANPEAALADWIDVTKLDPKNSDAFYYAAIILRAQRQYDRALALLQNSINLKPNHATYYSARAQVYRRQGQFQKALDDLNHILTKIEVKAEVLNDRGELYRAMAKLKESEADYAQSIKMAPKQTDAYIGLAATYVKQGKATESESCYDKMVAVNPDAAKVYLRRGEYRRDVGKFDLALADCDKAASLDPKTPHVALLRASISAARGNGKQAILAGEKALEGVKRSGAVNHDAACIWSLASKAADVSPEMAKAYSDKAAAFLKDALEKGFLDLNYEAINRMPEEPALAPILGHPIVKELFK
jgi:tetratricopeptide (TPR) repeat protein